MPQLVESKVSLSTARAPALDPAFQDVGGLCVRPFQSDAWLRHWMEHRASEMTPYPIVIDGGTATARFGLSRVTGLRILRLLGSGDSDFNGLISTRDAGWAWDRVIETLARRRGEWDLLHLHSVAEREAIQTALKRHFGHQGAARMYEACPLIRITGTWAEFLGGRKSLRREVSRWTRRLEELGPCTFRSTRPPIEREMLDILVDIERDSWKWERGNAALKPGSQRNFLVAVLQDAEAPVRVWTLAVGDRTVAFAIVLESDVRWFYYLTAYRREFKNAGSLLLAHIVEAAHEAGCESFSLLRGDLQYKNDWATETEYVHEILYASTARGKLGEFAYQLRWRGAVSPLIRRARSAWNAVIRR